MGCNDIDADKQFDDVKPNTTYKLKVGYHLADTTSPVKIEVKNPFGDVTFLTQTIKINK